MRSNALSTNGVIDSDVELLVSLPPHGGAAEHRAMQATHAMEKRLEMQNIIYIYISEVYMYTKEI